MRKISLVFIGLLMLLSLGLTACGRVRNTVNSSPTTLSAPAQDNGADSAAPTSIPAATASSSTAPTDVVSAANDINAQLNDVSQLLSGTDTNIQIP